MGGGGGGGDSHQGGSLDSKLQGPDGYIIGKTGNFGNDVNKYGFKGLSLQSFSFLFSYTDTISVLLIY